MNLTTKIIIGLIIVVIIYVVAQYVRTRHYINTGIALANAAVRYEQHPANPTQRLLVIGDSTAVGTGASKPEMSTAGLIGENHPTTEIINRGVNGARVADLPPRFKEFNDHEFDVVLIQIGGNDIVRFTDWTELEQNLKLVLMEANRVGKQVLILHCGNFGTAKLFPFGTRWIFTQRTAKLRELYQRVVPDYQATYIDLWRLGNADPFAREPYKFYATDLFHPSDAGYADWYEHIKPLLQA